MSFPILECTFHMTWHQKSQKAMTSCKHVCMGICMAYFCQDAQGWMIVKYIFQLSSFQLCIHENCLPYLFLSNLSLKSCRWQVYNLTSFVWNCVIIQFCCDYHIVTSNVIWMTLKTQTQAFLLSLQILTLILLKNF